MPDAELRRPRAAFRRGLLRATAAASVILAVIAGLALAAVNRARRAEEEQRALRRTLYAADMSLADQAWEVGNLGLARELLEAHRPERDRAELRGFEWRFLWLLTRGDDCFSFGGHTDRRRSGAVSVGRAPQWQSQTTRNWERDAANRV